MIPRKPCDAGPLPRSLTPGLDAWVIKNCTNGSPTKGDLEERLFHQLPNINAESLRGCLTKLVKAGRLRKGKGTGCAITYTQA